jgi:hypothetical protein
MIERPKIPLGGEIINPYTLKRDSGNYLIMSCGSSDEQFGSVVSDESKNIPLRKWIRIQQLGLGKALRKVESDEAY